MTGPTENELRQSILEIGRRMYQRGFVAANDGNISARFNDERILATPTGCSKGFMDAEELPMVDLDGNVLSGAKPSSELPLHLYIYRERRDVNAVVHNHSHEIIPFGVTPTALRPLLHMASTMGGNVPVWDIRDNFGDTNLLVTNMESGRDLASCLGDGRVALMRGHGCAVACGTVKEAVQLSIYLQVNARIQLQAMQLGDPVYLSPGEIARAEETYFGELAVARSWEYWSLRAGCGNL